MRINRVVVYSNNGVIGKCPIYLFRLAQIWHFFTGYNHLRFIGSYVR